MQKSIKEELEQIHSDLTEKSTPIKIETLRRLLSLLIEAMDSVSVTESSLIKDYSAAIHVYQDNWQSAPLPFSTQEFNQNENYWTLCGIGNSMIHCICNLYRLPYDYSDDEAKKQIPLKYLGTSKCLNLGIIPFDPAWFEVADEQETSAVK